MEKIVWNKDMYVGIEEMDTQHEKLTALINELYDAWQKGKEKEVLQDVISQVHDYVDYHFSTEQGLMDKYEYPEADAHTDQHDEFILKSVDHLTAYAEDEEDADELAPEVLEYLVNWWVTHINGTDRILAAFLKKQGVS